MLKSVLNYLERSEDRFPDKEAVIDERGSDTYRGLAEQARRVGTFLAERGLKENGVVAVLIGKNRAAQIGRAHV